MASHADTVHLFGIRHHGPGSARSLLQALQTLQPDCLLVEGPPEGEALLGRLLDPALQPPVAMLVYAQDEPGLAAFFPFAEFSPEWQALRWAAANSIATRFIDLPQAHAMAAEQDRRNAAASTCAAQGSDAVQGDDANAHPRVAVDLGDVPAHEAPHGSLDPLDWIAKAAGDVDGEAWWNRMVEERGDTASLFDGIAEVMAAVRQLPDTWHRPDRARHEALREAWMRQCIREAVKAGHQRVAVVCGAWHVPALQAPATAKADAALLKGLPRIKVQATWAPWTYRNLSTASGYGAGVTSPGWYEYLWRDSQIAATGPVDAGGDRAATRRTAGWLATVARLLRARDLDCSSAHLIEATRLAETLAALRGQSSPGLDEINEAITCVICMGETAPLRLIRDALIVGEVLGSVPADVPQVPLQRDIEQQHKSLRLKPEAGEKLLALDLRKDLDLQRSHFLHRLRLLGIDWGRPAADAQRNRGTFRETWQLLWQPEMVVRTIEASVHGATLQEAAATKVRQSMTADTPLPDMAQAIDDALLARLPELVASLMALLQERAAATGDVAQLLQALPPLAQVYRYGSVRQTDTALLAGVVDGLVLRAAIGLPVACMALDEEAARSMRGHVLGAQDALRLRDAAPDADAPRKAWQGALRSLAAGEACAPLLRGLACRLLLDAKLLEPSAVAGQLGRNLSVGAPPLEAAMWLDGFLNDQALVLQHDEAVWGAVDSWLSQLGDASFVQILPLLRRSFAAFAPHERQDLADKARRTLVPDAGITARAAEAKTLTPAWDEARASQAIGLLETLLGLPLGRASTQGTPASVGRQEPMP